MNGLLLSVIMPVYNQEKLLAQAIESVLNQSCKDFEFLMFDDGSADQSPEIMKQYAIYFHRKAGFNLYLKKYGKFFCQITIATLMDYKYVSASLKNRRKLFKK